MVSTSPLSSRIAVRTPAGVPTLLTLATVPPDGDEVSGKTPNRVVSSTTRMACPCRAAAAEDVALRHRGEFRSISGAQVAADVRSGQARGSRLRRVRRFSRHVLPVALLALVAGYARWAAAEQPQIPEEIVAIWKETVLTTANRLPTRGFGGRLMFYNARSESPMQVEGSLVVYAFDEDGRSLDELKPDRRFVFTAEQFAQHYRKSDVGHYYSVWLPWDEVGGPQKTIGLVVHFRPNGAPVVKAEQTRHVLSGVAAPPRELVRPARQPQRQQVRPVYHQESAPGRPNRRQADLLQRPPRRMSTTTLQVPFPFRNRPERAVCLTPGFQTQRSPAYARQRVDFNMPPAAPQQPPGRELRFPSRAPAPWARSTPGDVFFPRPGIDGSTGNTVLEVAAVANVFRPRDGAFGQPGPADKSAAPAIFVAAEAEDESPPRESPPVEEPAVTRTADQETALAGGSPRGRPISDTSPVRVRENMQGPNSSVDWLGTGIVQVVGTLVGLFISLPICALALFCVLRRIGAVKLGPLLRVEIANPSFGVAAAGGENSPSVSDVPVPIADFGDHCTALGPLGENCDERQQAEQGKRQEKEILRQITEKNVILRRTMSRLGRAA